MKKTLLLGALAISLGLLPSLAGAAPVAIYNSIDPSPGDPNIFRPLQGRPGSTTRNRNTENYTAPLGASFWGTEWNAANSIVAGSTNYEITRLDFYLAYDNAVSFTNLDINVRFWNSFGDNTSGVWFADAATPIGLPALTTQTFTITTASLGVPRFTTAAANVYIVSLDFTSIGHAPVQINDGSLNGTVINVLGDGQLTNALTGIRTRSSNGFVVGGTDITSVGTDGIPDVNRGGHFRNFNERTDFNFENDRNAADGFDLVTPGTDNTYEAYGMRLFVDVPVVVPEANTFALLALGSLVPIVGLVRRNRK